MSQICPVPVGMMMPSPSVVEFGTTRPDVFPPPNVQMIPDPAAPPRVACRSAALIVVGVTVCVFAAVVTAPWELSSSYTAVSAEPFVPVPAENRASATATATAVVLNTATSTTRGRTAAVDQMEPSGSVADPAPADRNATENLAITLLSSVP